MYMFYSIITLSFSMIFILVGQIYSNTFNVMPFLAGLGTSFVPFISTITIVLTNLHMPVEVIAFIGIFTLVFSIVQTYLIIEIIVSHVPTVNT